MRQIDEMTQHNAALVEETNAALEQTEAQASELDRVIGVFTLDDATAAEAGTRGLQKGLRASADGYGGRRRAGG